MKRLCGQRTFLLFCLMQAAILAANGANAQSTLDRGAGQTKYVPIKTCLAPSPPSFSSIYSGSFGAKSGSNNAGKSPDLLTAEQATDEADRLEDQKKFAEAIPYYNRAIKLAPTAARYCNRGVAYDHLGDTKSALRDYQEAVRLDPKDPVSLTDLAIALDTLDRYTEAMDACTRALAIDPTHQKTLLERAFVYRMTDECEKALTDLERARKLSPNDAWVYAGLGNTYLKMKKYNEAVENFTSSIQIQPVESSYDGREQAYAGLMQLDRAEEDAHSALRLNPKYSLAYFRLGEINGLRDRHADSEDNYLKCLELSPNEHAADFNLGNQYRQEGKYDLAIKCYSKYLITYPNDTDSHFNLGRCYVAKGQYDQAIAEFDRVLALKPLDMSTVWERGRAYQGAGRQKQAIDAYTMLLAQQPPVNNYLDVLYQRAGAYNSMAQNEDALKDYDQLIAKMEKPDSDYYSGRAHSLAMLGRYTEALAASSKAFALNSGNAQAYADRAICYRIMDRDDECMKDADAALKIDPKNVDALQCEACIELNRNHLDAAEHDIDLALAQAPNMAFNHCIKAGIEIDKGDYDAAQQQIEQAANFDDCSYLNYVVRFQFYANKTDYKKAIEVCNEGIARMPNTPKLYNLRSEAYEDLLDYDSALADASHAIEMQPANPKFYAFRAAVYRRAKQYDKAVADVNKAIALTPDNPTLFAQRAAIERVQKQYDLAIADYNKAETLQPNACIYAIERGYIYEDEIKPDLAIAEFEKAIKISPDKSDGYNCLARSYMQSKDYDAIIREANRGIAALPSDPACYDTRGDAYLLKEDFQKAYDDYSKAVSLSPYSTAYLYDRQRTGLKIGKYAESLIDADQEVKLAPYPSNIYDRALVEFCVGQYQKSAEDFTRAIDPKDWGEGNPHPTYAAIFAAIAYKQLGQEGKASEVLSRPELDSAKWPYPCVQFLQGKISADELTAKTTDAGKSDNEKLTEAKTYIALTAAQQGNKSLADENFHWIQQNGPKGFDEYMITLARLNHADNTVAETSPPSSSPSDATASRNPPVTSTATNSTAAPASPPDTTSSRNPPATATATNSTEAPSSPSDTNSGQNQPVISTASITESFVHHPAAFPSTRLIAWSLGMDISLAALLDGTGAPAPDVQEMLKKTQILAGALKVTLPQLPARTGKTDADLVVDLHYILKDLGPVGMEINKKYGMPQASLFEIAVKTSMLRVLYSPGGNLGTAIAEVVSRDGPATGLPEKMWKPLVDKIHGKVPIDQIKLALNKLEDDVHEYYENDQSSPPAISNTHPTPVHAAAAGRTSKAANFAAARHQKATAVKHAKPGYMEINQFEQTFGKYFKAK